MQGLFHVNERQHSAVLFLAALAKKPEVFQAIGDIAKELHMSAGYLEEIVTALKQGALIEGKKGPGGGYRMAKKPEEVTALDVLVAVEGPLELVACQRGAVCPIEHGCSSKKVWTVLQTAMRDSLASIRFSQLV